MVGLLKRQGLFLVFGVLLSQYCLGHDFPLQAVSYPAEYERDSRTYLIQGDMTPVIFYFWGSKFNITNPQLVLHVPDSIKVIYAFHIGYWTYRAIELKTNMRSVARKSTVRSAIFRPKSLLSI